MFDILMIQDTYLWAYQKPFLQHRLMFWWTQCRKFKAQEKKNEFSKLLRKIERDKPFGKRDAADADKDDWWMPAGYSHWRRTDWCSHCNQRHCQTSGKQPKRRNREEGGKSNRRYVDDAVVAATIEAAGYDPYEKKLLGIIYLKKPHISYLVMTVLTDFTNAHQELPHMSISLQHYCLSISN